MAGEWSVVSHDGSGMIWDVAQFAGGTLDISIENIEPPVTFAGDVTICALFLDYNNVPVSDKNPAIVPDIYTGINNNSPSNINASKYDYLDNAWNTVVIVPFLTGPLNTTVGSTGTQSVNGLNIPVPRDARKMMWVYYRNISKPNQYQAVLQAGDKLLQTISSKYAYNSARYYGGLYTLKQLIRANNINPTIEIGEIVPSANRFGFSSGSDGWPGTPLSTMPMESGYEITRSYYPGKSIIIEGIEYPAIEAIHNVSVFNQQEAGTRDLAKYLYNFRLSGNISVLGKGYVNIAPDVSIDAISNPIISSEGNITITTSEVYTDGDTVIYQWSILNDDGTMGTLSNTNLSVTTFNAPKVYHYEGNRDITIQLVYTDGVNPPQTDQITITVEAMFNRPPTTRIKEEYLQLDGGTTILLMDINVEDPDGDTLTYTWRQDNTSTQVDLGIVDNGADLVNDGYELTLPILNYGTTIKNATLICEISDGYGGILEKKYHITINTEANEPPYVDAGEDQFIAKENIPIDPNSNLRINLNGSYKDPNEGEDNITFYWEQISGFPVELIDTNNNPTKTILNPSFIPPKLNHNTGNREFVFRLNVNDNVNPPVSADVTITLEAPLNTRPIVNTTEIMETVDAGIPYSFTITEGIDGMVYDADGDTLNYTYKQISGPLLIDTVTGDPLTDFGDTNNINVQFPNVSQSINETNEVRIDVTVSDGTLLAANKITYIFTINRDANIPPVADAGKSFARQYVDGLTIDLDGSKSYDDDNGPSSLSYSWQLIEPQIIGFNITNPTSPKPSFIVPAMTSSDSTKIMVFRLTVSDGLDTDTSDVTVTIAPPEPEVVDGNIYYDETTLEVVVDGTPNPVTMQNIYDVLSAADPSQMWCQKLGDSFYMITSQGGIRIKNNAMIEDKSISLVVTGDKFIIEKGSSLQFGTYDPINDATSDGCFLSMPNIKTSPYYSFGNYLNAAGDATESGNLYLYASNIDVWNFWGFFSGPDQEVHILDCVVNGYGRVEGTTSRLRNVTFQQSHIRFGIISVKGEIQQYESLISQTSEGASFFYNPRLVGQEMLVKNSEFKNYANLVYSEDNPDVNLKVCRFLDCKFGDNYNVSPLGNNIEVVISYTFKPIITNYNFEVYQNVDIEISDQYGQVVFTGQTDEFGKIDTMLDVRMKPDYESLVFNIRLTKEGEFVDYRYEHDETPWINKPLYIRDPILEPLNQPVDPTDPGNPNPGLDIVISPDATSVVYVSEYTTKKMEEMKTNILNWIAANAPDDAIGAIYTDRARHAYDKRPSYDELLMKALSGDIKRIYTYEEETFGPTRKDITIDLLVLSGIDVVYTAT